MISLFLIKNIYLHQKRNGLAIKGFWKTYHYITFKCLYLPNMGLEKNEKGRLRTLRCDLGRSH